MRACMTWVERRAGGGNGACQDHTRLSLDVAHLLVHGGLHACQARRHRDAPLTSSPAIDRITLRTITEGRRLLPRPSLPPTLAYGSQPCLNPSPAWSAPSVQPQLV